MLPRINTEDRTELANNRVLVLVRLDADVAGLDVLDQPSPTTTLDASEGGVELLFESVEAAVAVIDGLGESARRRLAAALGLGREVLPEESVVDVTTYSKTSSAFALVSCTSPMSRLEFWHICASKHPHFLRHKVLD